MPDRRREIRMTPDEVRRFLEQPHVMTVATLGADGQPHLVAMWYAIVDGDLSFWTYAKSQKVRNLNRDARVTCLVHAGERYGELRGVQIAGSAEVIEDAARVVEVGTAVHRRYVGGEVTEDVRRSIRAMAQKRVAVAVHTEQVVSWDHRKLTGA
jgi:PPOX class probable F420-dependent enzyme